MDQNIKRKFKVKILKESEHNKNKTGILVWIVENMETLRLFKS